MIDKKTKRLMMAQYVSGVPLPTLATRFSMTEEEVKYFLRMSGVEFKDDNRDEISRNRLAIMEAKVAKGKTDLLKMRDQRDHYKKRVTLLEAELRRRNIRVP